MKVLKIFIQSDMVNIDFISTKKLNLRPTNGKKRNQENSFQLKSHKKSNPKCYVIRYHPLKHEWKNLLCNQITVNLLQTRKYG